MSDKTRKDDENETYTEKHKGFLMYAGDKLLTFLCAAGGAALGTWGINKFTNSESAAAGDDI